MKNNVSLLFELVAHSIVCAALLIVATVIASITFSEAIPFIAIYAGLVAVNLIWINLDKIANFINSKN